MLKKQRAFTIIELLTSLVIIALLIGLLLPSIAAIRRNAKDTAQRAQFIAIEAGLDAFKQDYGDYPSSGRFDITNNSYCGTMKLAEAMLGWDLQGFHPNTAWRRDGYDATGGNMTYDPPIPPLNNRTRFLDSPTNSKPATLFERKGSYLELAKTSVYHIGESAAGKNDGLYNTAEVTKWGLDPYNYVLCDVYGVRKLNDAAGKPVLAGSPILYFKANTASKSLDSAHSADATQVYNYIDNIDLIYLGKLNATGVRDVYHPISAPNGNGVNFYWSEFKYQPGLPPNPFGGSGRGFGIRDPKIPLATPWPYNPESYIIISAGADGLYGTSDDIHNF